MDWCLACCLAAHSPGRLPGWLLSRFLIFSSAARSFFFSFSEKNPIATIYYTKYLSAFPQIFYPSFRLIHLMLLGSIGRLGRCLSDRPSDRATDPPSERVGERATDALLCPSLLSSSFSWFLSAGFRSVPLFRTTEPSCRSSPFCLYLSLSFGYSFSLRSEIRPFVRPSVGRSVRVLASFLSSRFYPEPSVTG